MKTLTTTRRVYGGNNDESDDNTAGTMWRPTDFDDFHDGGAYPEVFAVQFPSEIGWQKKEINSEMEINDTISCPPSLPVDMETLMKDSTETMLRVKGGNHRNRTTDAYESYKAFVRAFERDDEAKEIETFGSLCEAKSIEIIDNDTVDAKMFENEFVTCENGVGKPCVVRNIFKDRFHGVDLLDLFPEEMLTVNDKAPARRTDKGAMRQNTLLVTSKRYKEYMDDYEKCNEDDDDAKPAPFYNNGWQIFSKHPEKVNPYFANMASCVYSSGGRNRNNFTRNVQIRSEIVIRATHAIARRRDDRKRIEIAEQSVHRPGRMYHSPSLRRAKRARFFSANQRTKAVCPVSSRSRCWRDKLLLERGRTDGNEPIVDRSFAAYS